jgi:hypothetical protein
MRLVLLALLAAALPAAAQPADLYPIQKDVAFLSSDLLGGRATGTEGEALAARYISERMAEIGLEPAGEGGTWFQPFAFAHSANPHAAPGEGEQLAGRNVAGRIDNGAAETVVIGAHYDHLGMGGMGSRAPGQAAIHNGADDNASGVAALLAAAEHLARPDAPRDRNYLFVAFSGEEMGLFGSKHFAERLPAGVAYMLNFDMVGRLGAGGELAVNGSGTSPVWPGAIADAASSLALDPSLHASGLGPSDHASFYLKDIPVLHLFTGQHADYHTPADDAHLINYDGIERVARLAVRIVEETAGAPVAFTKTQDESQGRMRFNVSLGIMPDYVYSGEGMRIDAVMDNRPGKAAGMQDGDVLVALGGQPIVTMQDYMRMLGELQPGATVPAVVQRGESRVELTVTF